MKLFIDPRVAKIPVVAEFIQLFNSYSRTNSEGEVEIVNPLEETDGYYVVEDIYDVNCAENKVRDFVEYYLEVSGIEYSSSLVTYIVCRLYAAKGYEQLFDVFEELLGLSMTASIFYKFIVSITIDTYNYSDVLKFFNKLYAALYHLLLISEDFTLYILSLAINQESSVTHSVELESYLMTNNQIQISEYFE